MATYRGSSGARAIGYHNTHRAKIRYVRDNIARIERRMPYSCRETQRVAEWTLRRLNAQLRELEGE